MQKVVTDYRWCEQSPGSHWEHIGSRIGFDYHGHLWRRTRMLIGIAGHLRAGKDTIAAHLCATYRYVRLGFADALKREVQRTLRRTLTEYVRTHYGVTTAPDEKIHELLHIARDPVTRALLQEWGTDLRRTEDPQYWVRHWQRAYTDHPAQRIVCPDVRFPNEARCILGYGGSLWVVRRPDSAADGHASESWCDEFSQWDAVFHNTGTIGDLTAQVDAALNATTTPTRPVSP